MSPWRWVSEAVVIATHDEQLAEHGGAPGVRDLALLQSALARPKNLVAYGSPDIAALTAAYACGITKNHPFVDGNKRAGFMTGYVFMERNGLAFTASEAEAAQAVLELAAGSIDETGFALFLRDHSKRARKRAK